MKTSGGCAPRTPHRKRHSPPPRLPRVRATLLALLVLLAGCASPAAAPPKQYPDSMAAIGDSITAGVNVARDKVGESPGPPWSVGDPPHDGVPTHHGPLLPPPPAIQGHGAAP